MGWMYVEQTMVTMAGVIGIINAVSPVQRSWSRAPPESRGSTSDGVLATGEPSGSPGEPRGGSAEGLVEAPCADRRKHSCAATRPTHAHAARARIHEQLQSQEERPINDGGRETLQARAWKLLPGALVSVHEATAQGDAHCHRRRA